MSYPLRPSRSPSPQPVPGPVSARRPGRMQPVPGTVAYHRMGRAQRNHRWWRPLLALVTAAGLYLVFILLITFWGVAVPLVLAGVARSVVTGSTVPDPDAGQNPFGPGAPGSAGTDILPGWLTADPTFTDMGNPVTFVAAIVSIIPMLPAVWLATWLVWRRPPGTLSSVFGRLRWAWLGRAIGWAALIIVPVLVLQLGFDAQFAPEGPGATGGGTDGDTASAGGAGLGRALLMIVLTLLLAPVQSATEEYVFRGFLGQLVGSWLKHPAWAILLPLPLFVFGHLYDWTGLADVAVFAVVAGWLCYRTGGLEAAIAVHIVNNVSVFLLGAVGLADLNAAGQSLPGLLVSAGMTVGTGALLAWRAPKLPAPAQPNRVLPT
ncbi:CPBP family intramembrane metalloprotease [Brevibacterium sp. 91QC2O2]|uniref:CPBP family intramembrane glutamic endopeptidase n=1 Tax=Brevibacterium sp. 91QC2O2 TaxID=2968458 RepID=UPI00211C7A68|nr:type II CAAX endopeptidase family protein [Brevibacterium sp. 91QC2O2]MCQ9369295.1 CPBP family intramembrane metalloprotease [Brevibacterium sp. 91QC2O2]